MKRNELFDINKLPNEEGILFFGLSISKLNSSQSPKKLFEYIEHLVKKVRKPIVGVNFVYSDNLYLYSGEKARDLKTKHQIMINDHKNGFLAILKKNQWYIQKSFSFITWSQLLLEIKDYNGLFKEISELYKKDKEFKKNVNKDVKYSEKKITDDNINFILEEILVLYLVSKGKVRLFNEYVQDKEKWILQCYPGKPLYSEVYLHQENLLGLSNLMNKYQSSFYDLEGKKLYKYIDIKLEKEIL